MSKKTIWPRNWGLLYAAFAFSQGIGLLSYWTLPILAGSLITGMGLSPTEIGTIGTVEFSGLFVASLFLAPFVDRGYRRRVAIISLLIAISINIACAMLDLTYGSLSVFRFIGGLGSGLALAIGNATIANARDAEKFSGHMTIALVAFMVVIMPFLSRISEAYGFQGVYGALAFIMAIAGFSIFYLPDGPNMELANKSDIAEGDIVAEQRDGIGAVNIGLFTFVGMAFLAIALVFGIRDTLPWAVSEQLGTNAGMTLPQVGDLFSLMYAISILGPVAALILARYWSGTVILAVTMLLTGILAWVFTVSEGNFMRFSIGIVAWGTIYFAAFAQLNAVAAILDRKGRLVSAVGSSFIAGVMVAPVLGGYLMENGGYAQLGLAELLLTCVILILIYFGLRGRISSKNSR